MSEATKKQIEEEKAEVMTAQETAKAKKGETAKAKKEESKRIAPPEYGPDVMIRVPKDPQNPDVLTIPVNINNYSWEIKRGESQTVPQAVVEVLENAGYL